MTNEELIAELKAAVARRDKARIDRGILLESLAEFKGKIRVADEALAKLDTTVEAIQHELVTGETGLGLIDAAARNGHAAKDNDRGAKRQERERAVAKTTSTADPLAEKQWFEETDEFEGRVAPSWDRKCAFAIDLVLESGQPARVGVYLEHFDSHHASLALKGGLISSTGHRSCIVPIEQMEAIPLPAFAVGICRVRATIQGEKVLEPNDAPEWRHHAIGMLGVEKRDAGPLRKLHITTLGELDDQLVYARGGDLVEAGLSAPGLERVKEALDRYRSKLPDIEPGKDKLPDRLTKAAAELRASGSIEAAAMLDASRTRHVNGVTNELDLELLHALTHPQPDATGKPGATLKVPDWAPLLDGGATNDAIRRELEAIWPDHVMVLVPPEASGGLHGYTVATGFRLAIWIGGFKGPLHKPDLANGDLIDRVRFLLEIPTPSAASKIAKARASSPGNKTVSADTANERPRFADAPKCRA